MVGVAECLAAALSPLQAEDGEHLTSQIPMVHRRGPTVNHGTRLDGNLPYLSLTNLIGWSDVTVSLTN